MEMNEYGKKAMSTALPSAKNMNYAVALLASEAGEFAGHWSKCIRDHDGEIPEDKALLMIKEMGDVQWSLALLAELMGMTLEDIAKINLYKLESRKKRGVIGGSGDNR